MGKSWTSIIRRGTAGERWRISVVLLAGLAAGGGCSTPEPFRQSLGMDARTGTDMRTGTTDLGAGPVDRGSGTTDTTDTPAVPGDGVQRPLIPMGSPCSMSSDCESNFCADGVCCASACTDKCLSCATPAAMGRCVAAERDTDPRNECADEGASSCGNIGVCDGTGACRKYPAGTTCRNMSCAGSTLTSAGRCDGSGQCAASQSQSCAPFTCDTAGQCRTTCAVTTDCVAPAVCVGGVCGRKSIGVACSAPDQCNSGFCEEGVCCATSCNGLCQSCAVAGSAGTCTKIPVSINPSCPDSCSATVACPAPSVCRDSVCGGLRGQYFDNIDLTNPQVTRTDAAIDFILGDNDRPDPSIQLGSWSARWQGDVVPRFSQTYTFYTQTDDGARLWVDNRLLIDDWVDHAVIERSATISLVAGRAYPIRLEYYNNTGAATARLLWSSASEAKAIISTANLRP